MIVDFLNRARISLGRGVKSTAEHHFLFRAIQNRHSYQLPFSNHQIPLSSILELEAAAGAEWFGDVAGLHIDQDIHEERGNLLTLDPSQGAPTQ